MSLVATGTAVPARAAQDSPEMMTMLPGEAMTVTDVYKQNVYDPQDNEIGDVNDVLLNKSGQVTAVIVGVGGFLGVGEKDVAVPFTALAFKEKDGKRYLVMNATKEALQSAPG
jgi:sporulation protein YlmC with PRC-barrel domain